jgi:hypothetical protein
MTDRANELVAELEALAGPAKSAAHARKRARLAAYVAAKSEAGNPPPPVQVPLGWRAVASGLWDRLKGT